MGTVFFLFVVICLIFIVYRIENDTRPEIIETMMEDLPSKKKEPVIDDSTWEEWPRLYDERPIMRAMTEEEIEEKIRRKIEDQENIDEDPIYMVR